METARTDEFEFFMNRYRQVVFGFVTNDLYDFTRPPEKRSEIKRVTVDGKLIVAGGPYRTERHYNVDHECTYLFKEKFVFGPSRYDNLLEMVKRVVDNRFPMTIKRYAVNDRDYKYCRDCADELVYELKKYWGLA